MDERATRYWIVVMAKAHVDVAVAGGYVEINHGKAGPLERMQAGDGVACYSPRLDYPDGAALQAFTALGAVDGTPIYQCSAGPAPFRRRVDWRCVAPAPIRPLLEHLDFIRNKADWGAALRFGVVRVEASDFQSITAAMGAAT